MRKKRQNNTSAASAAMTRGNQGNWAAEDQRTSGEEEMRIKEESDSETSEFYHEEGAAGGWERASQEEGGFRKERADCSFSTEEEECLVEFFSANPIFYDKSLAEYKHQQQKDRLLDQLAIDLHTTRKQIQGWFKHMRSTVGKLFKSIESGQINRPLTARKKWQLQNFAFLKAFIIPRTYSLETTQLEEMEEQSEDEESLHSPSTSTAAIINKPPASSRKSKKDDLLIKILDRPRPEEVLSRQLETTAAAPAPPQPDLDERTAFAQWIAARMPRIPHDRWDDFQLAAMRLIQDYSRPRPNPDTYPSPSALTRQVQQQWSLSQQQQWGQVQAWQQQRLQQSIGEPGMSCAGVPSASPFPVSVHVSRVSAPNMAEKRRADEGESIMVHESKKAKSDGKTGTQDDPHWATPLSSFQGFELIKVLNDHPKNKSVFVHGKFKGHEEEAVVILEKTPFSEETLPITLSGETKLKVGLKNDIYGNYYGTPPPQVSGIKVSVVYPATQKHLVKYSQQEMYLVQETQDDFRNITLPFLQAEAFRMQWVYNILEHKTESERIVYEDNNKETGFILLPDMKWDLKQINDLYLIAIVHKHGIRSLRNLTAEHLPLLRNILTKGQQAIQEKFGLPPCKLRIYLHYQPSYYHLHVHFTHLKFDAPGSGVERAHLLTDVIDHLDMMTDYYAKKTLSFCLRENDQLLAEFRKAGRVPEKSA